MGTSQSLKLIEPHHILNMTSRRRDFQKRLIEGDDKQQIWVSIRSDTESKSSASKCSSGKVSNSCDDLYRASTLSSRHRQVVRPETHYRTQSLCRNICKGCREKKFISKKSG